MLAALSASLSRDSGQKASAPSLFEAALTGAPILFDRSLPPALIFSHVLCEDDIVMKTCERKERGKHETKVKESRPFLPDPHHRHSLLACSKIFGTVSRFGQFKIQRLLNVSPRDLPRGRRIGSEVKWKVLLAMHADIILQELEATPSLTLSMSASGVGDGNSSI